MFFPFFVKFKLKQSQQVRERLLQLNTLTTTIECSVTFNGFNNKTHLNNIYIYLQLQQSNTSLNRKVFPFSLKNM